MKERLQKDGKCEKESKGQGNSRDGILAKWVWDGIMALFGAWLSPVRAHGSGP